MWYSTNTLKPARSVVLYKHVALQTRWRIIFITTFNTILLVEQELPTLPEYMSSALVIRRFELLYLEFYVYVLYIVVCPFVLFLLVMQLRILITPLASSNSSYQFCDGRLYWLWKPQYLPNVTVNFVRIMMNRIYTSQQKK